jgi:hypothetical protein
VSLKTTNCPDSLNEQLGQLTVKWITHVRRARNRARYASALILIEPRMRRINGYHHLPQLRANA